MAVPLEHQELDRSSDGLLNFTTVVIITVLVIVFSAITTTWCLSLLQSKPARPGTSNEPPVVSYYIPYLQHLIQFLSDPGALLQSSQKNYPNSPFSLIMMNTKFHVFNSPVTAAAVFGKSREFIFGPVLASMMENGLNLPLEDRAKFSVPISEKTNSSAFSKEEQASREFVETNHSVYIKYLTGKLLDGIMHVYIENFFPLLDEKLGIDKLQDKWQLINLHETMLEIVFYNSVKTFFGTRLQTFWPNMFKDWRTFNDATYAGVRSNFSFYLQPGASGARERMLKAFDQWVDCDMEEWKEDEGVWNEKWGIRMNWEREKLSRKYSFTLRGRACQQAGFLFVIITNAAPMATWFTMCIIQDAERLAQFRKESHSYLLPQDGCDPNDLRFDIAKLKGNPYIQGLWKEALRLGSASAAARVVSKDTELEGYVLKKGSVILLPVRLLHFDENVFPDPKRFEPQRWMSSLGDSAPMEEQDKELQKQRKQNASLRSFGGGAGLCSGRFVAEQEILSTVATMLLLFDIELDAGQGRFKLNPRSLGVMSPAKAITVKIRKRKNPRNDH